MTYSLQFKVQGGQVEVVTPPQNLNQVPDGTFTINGYTDPKGGTSISVSLIRPDQTLAASAQVYGGQPALKDQV